MLFYFVNDHDDVNVPCEFPKKIIPAFYYVTDLTNLSKSIHLYP
ncbi:hypothetical protein EMIT079MI2_150032 [Bacillus sp. IT-79MI2]